MVLLRYLTQIFHVLPDAKPKFALHPTQNPNASQWNIGCVGSLALGLCVGHVHFIFFVLISFALGSDANAVFGGIWALNNLIMPSGTT